MQNKKRIPANENVAFQRWEMPDLTGVRRRIAQRLDELQAEESDDSQQQESTPQLPTPEEIEALREEARQQGFTTGFEEGRQQGYEEGRALGYQEGEATGQDSGFQAGYQRGLDQAQHEVDQQLARLQGLIEQLQGPLQHLDQEVEDALLSLVDLITRAILRREISLDRNFLTQVLKESVAALPAGHQRLRIYLNPDDMPLAEAACQELLEDYRLVGDPAVAPGGVRIETLQSLVDSTLENRYKKIIDSLLDGGYQSRDVSLEPLPRDVLATPDTTPLNDLAFSEPKAAPAAPLQPEQTEPLVAAEQAHTEDPAAETTAEPESSMPVDEVVADLPEAVSRVSLQRGSAPRNLPALDNEAGKELPPPPPAAEIPESLADETPQASAQAAADIQPDFSQMTAEEEDEFFEKALDNLVQSAQSDASTQDASELADPDISELDDFLDSYTEDEGEAPLSAEAEDPESAESSDSDSTPESEKVWAPESVHDDRYLEDVLENTWLDDLNEDQDKPNG